MQININRTHPVIDAPSSPTATKASDMISKLNQPQLDFVNSIIFNSFVLIDSGRRQRVNDLFTTLGERVDNRCTAHSVAYYDFPMTTNCRT